MELPGTAPWETVRQRVAAVPGVANFSRTNAVPPDLEALKPATVAALAGQRFGSFRVTTKRSHKGFPRTSVEIDRELGGAIRSATGATVDLENPDLTVHVEVLQDRILYSLEKLPGPGGFPVGTAGRVAALLSGGIDSPVAAWRMMKRGCTVLLVHFHAF